MTDRKKDHIQLATEAQSHIKQFSFEPSELNYEPLWANHHAKLDGVELLGKKLQYPLWISSMTGGSELALEINKDLSILAQDLGMGMGLGSCRPFIEEADREQDFLLREYAPDILLSANLGIAQVDKYLQSNRWSEIEEKLETLNCDFLMVHINPLQEWFQPEGDEFSRAPLEILKELKKITKLKLGVKEVGQGFGPQSLKALVELELEVIELSGTGGTNFTMLEMIRDQNNDIDLENFSQIGHHWSQMVSWLNHIYSPSYKKFPMIIISGGIRTPLEAATAMKSARFPAMIGMAYPFLSWQQQGRVYLKMKVLEFCKNWAFAMSLIENKES